MEKKNTGVRKKVVIVLVGSIFVCMLIIYNTCIVKTVDSGNGYKHQTVIFGNCGFLDCENKAAHRIHSGLYNEYYCDDCWESNGARMFEILSGKEDNDSSDESTNAKVCAVKAVKDNLKSPSTADFCSYSEMTAENLGGDKWKISGYVDAENSMGAMLRQNWTVTLTLTSSGFTNYSVTFD